MYEAKGFESTDFAEFTRVVNDFLGTLEEGKLIDVKYNSVPLAISTHTEYGVYPDTKYTAIIILKKS
ncbi:sporulation protein Cse60 [Neobacillus sp. M.A.Huq-85]